MKFPEDITKIFKAFDVFNNLLILGSPQCYTRFDYVDRLITVTITPLVLILLLIFAFALHSLYRRGKIASFIGIYVNLGLLLLYVVLPPVTTTIFGMFVCVDIDPSYIIPSTPKYMNRDYSISCDSKRYQIGLKWAITMVFVYPVGLLSLYFWVLYYNRHDIEKRVGDNTDISNDLVVNEESDAVDRKECLKYIGAKEISFLYRAYEGKFWYWEVIETARRLILTAVLSVVAVGSNLQIIFGILIALLFIKLYGYYQPYERDDDDLLQEVAQYQIFMTLFVAFIIESGSFYSTFVLHLLYINDSYLMFMLLYK